MGINGLLQQLRSISHATHVSAYRGKKVAIDGYSWLHKGAYSCSRELCEGIWTDGYVRYFVGRIDTLLANGVVPIVIFDGCRLPLKADEEDNRRRGRREALDRARAHAESGNMAAATESYQRAVDIAPWMAKVVMEALRDRGVQCLVAPYEADAQMSYMAIRGDVHAVITEDSDMVAYGCPRVLYKLDKTGTGEEVLLADLPLVRELNMTGFDHEMLLQMCIMAGCDFLPNMQGVGIKKAHALIRKHRDFVKVVRALRFNGTSIPPGYEVRFQRTLWLFRHQRVFCPAARAMAHLRPLPQGGLGAANVLVLAAIPPEGAEREELPFLGPPMDPQIVAGIADGEIDPNTMRPFDLAAIYRGCHRPPQHLLPLLAALRPQPGPGPLGTATQQPTQQQQEGGSQAGPGTQGGGGGSQWHAGPSQRPRGFFGRPPVPPGNAQRGGNPAPPGKSIASFFVRSGLGPSAKPPAHPSGKAGAGAQGAKVVTLRGQTVELVSAKDSQPGGVSSAPDLGDRDASEGEDELGHGIKRRRRSWGGADGARPTVGGLLASTGKGKGGSLFAAFQLGVRGLRGPSSQPGASGQELAAGAAAEVSDEQAELAATGDNSQERSDAPAGATQSASGHTQGASQLDSQALSGAGGGDGGGAGGGEGAWARGAWAKRSVAPARLAMEALLSQPSCSEAASQPGLSQGGPATASQGFGSGAGLGPSKGPEAGPSRPNVLGALANLQRWRDGAAAAGTGSQMSGADELPSDPMGSLPSPSHQSPRGLPPQARGLGFGPGLGAGAGPPTAFDIYGDGLDLHLDSFGKPAPKAGGRARPAAGSLADLLRARVASHAGPHDEGEEEVESPLKAPEPRPCTGPGMRVAGLRRPRAASPGQRQPQTAVPSWQQPIRRRLSGEAGLHNPRARGQLAGLFPPELESGFDRDTSGGWGEEPSPEDELFARAAGGAEAGVGSGAEEEGLVPDGEGALAGSEDPETALLLKTLERNDARRSRRQSLMQRGGMQEDPPSPPLLGMATSPRGGRTQGPGAKRRSSADAHVHPDEASGESPGAPATCNEAGDASGPPRRTSLELGSGAVPDGRRRESSHPGPVPGPKPQAHAAPADGGGERLGGAEQPADGGGDQPEPADADEEDDVVITADVGGATGGDFHSVAHAEVFGGLARRAVNRIHDALKPKPKPPPPRPAANKTATAAEPQTQAQAKTRTQRNSLGGTGALFADFACVRATPKRRSSAGAAAGRAAKPAGVGYRSSVFVQPAAGTAEGRDGEDQENAGGPGGVDTVGFQMVEAPGARKNSAFAKLAVGQQQLRKPFVRPRTVLGGSQAATAVGPGMQQQGRGAAGFGAFACGL